jgi:hypothetical protein
MARRAALSRARPDWPAIAVWSTNAALWVACGLWIVGAFR